jgi:ankyrin
MEGYEDKTQDSIFPIKRYTKITTRDLPERFAVVSRLKKETFSVGQRGETMRSAVMPQVKVSIPEGAVSAGTKMSMQVNN